MTDFHGLPIRSIANDHLQLDFLADAGPRLVRLFLAHSLENLLAEVPDVHWPTPFGEYFLRGGHRVTLAPEALELSYVPDNTGLVVEEMPAGVRLRKGRDYTWYVWPGIGTRSAVKYGPEIGHRTFRYR